MELTSVLDSVSKSAALADWKKVHRNGFLAHVFVMLDDANAGSWQVGYYCPDTKKMTTFYVEKEGIRVSQESDIIPGEQGILPLDRKSVKLDPLAAVNVANQARAKEYAAEVPQKVFFVLQQADVPVFNITFFTRSFKTINMKISAVDGILRSHSSAVLFEQLPKDTNVNCK